MLLPPKNSFRCALPTELLHDILKATNTRKGAVEKGTILHTDAVSTSEWGKYAVKLTTSSSIFQILCGRSFILRKKSMEVHDPIFNNLVAYARQVIHDTPNNTNMSREEKTQLLTKYFAETVIEAVLDSEEPIAQQVTHISSMADTHVNYTNWLKGFFISESFKNELDYQQHWMIFNAEVQGLFTLGNILSPYGEFCVLKAIRIAIDVKKEIKPHGRVEKCTRTVERQIEAFNRAWATLGVDQNTPLEQLEQQIIKLNNRVMWPRQARTARLNRRRRGPRRLNQQQQGQEQQHQEGEADQQQVSDEESPLAPGEEQNDEDNSVYWDKSGSESDNEKTVATQNQQEDVIGEEQQQMYGEGGSGTSGGGDNVGYPSGSGSSSSRYRPYGYRGKKS